MNPTYLRSTLVLTAILALLATGCAKKSPAPPPAPPAPTSGETSPKPSNDSGTPTPGNTNPGGTTTGTGTVGDLKTIYFALDSYMLDDAARAGLDANARVLRGNSALRVKVEGYCDERGTVEYNEALGQKRADAVREYLIAAGVPAGQLVSVTMGEEFPVDEGHDESAWSKNRRAEFKGQ